MWYMGGKYRQRKAIVEALRPYAHEGFTYVEPFCGAMWSAAAVCDRLRPGRAILNDINRPLIALWRRVLDEGVDWLPTDMGEIEANYQYYKHDAPDDDPLKAWYGIACSFGGKWFGGVARCKDKTDFKPQVRSTARKADVLRPYHPELSCGSYKELPVPDEAVVYCDPPYQGRVKAHYFETFDYDEFWQWVRDLSSRCTVFTSCFECPGDFVTVHSWGDTVVRHNHGKGPDGTCEKLVVLPC